MNEIICGDCRKVMAGRPAESVDAVVCDPPAGISFMGKCWDKNRGGRDRWIEWMEGIAAECLRLLKPGGYALVWSIPRTAHWTATAWENAGFEVRDKVYYLFGSGFPKSLAVGKAIDKLKGAEREVVGKKPGYCPGRKKSWGFAPESGWNENENGHMTGMIETAPATPEAKQWDGYGTALKPAAEEWHVLRKPLEGTVAQNVLKHGCGGINVDGCRVGTEQRAHIQRRNDKSLDGAVYGSGINGSRALGTTDKGRWPANVAHDGSEEVLRGFPETKSRRSDTPQPIKTSKGIKGGAFGNSEACKPEGHPAHPTYVRGGFDDSGSAARYFYCAKASRKERTCGGKVVNNHATVKPLALMRWLVRLVTPPGGVVLDPFCGSGTTLVAARDEGFHYIGIDNNEDYVAIARQRLEATEMALFK